MSSSALIAGALLLGLGGSAHCAAMCGAPCAALTREPAGLRAFHASRALSYMAVGALAAASVSSLAVLREAWPVLRPLWVLLHMAVLALGLWLVVTGRQPEWRFGRAPALLAAGAGGGWVPLRGPARPGLAGLAWAAWPCGLLQSALVLAALADGPWGGAAVMGAFALGSLPGLWAGPALLARLSRVLGRRFSVRLAGVALLSASAWALGHGVWEKVAAWCLA